MGGSEGLAAAGCAGTLEDHLTWGGIAMHAHDYDVPESMRPKGSRVDGRTDAVSARAAAEGRWDVVGADGMAQLQRSAGNSAVNAALSDEPERSPVHDVVSSGGGRPLEPEVRSDMEARLGSDFADVRVHDDGRAHDSAVAVNANAYTVGSNIVFQRDRYDPSSQQGQVTLAHELTHVVQQRSGPVDGTSAAGGIKVSDPSDRFEREASANAERVMSAPAPAQASPSGAAVQRESADESVVQREGEEEEEVQGSFVDAAVQREGEEEEEEVQGSFVDAAVQREGEEEVEEEAAPAS
jgi:hypothetical protein